jgi:hypothetical protein
MVGLSLASHWLMPYNLLMPKEEPRSLRPWWLPVWQRRWWIALAALFVLVWWLVPPLLYRHTGTGADARLKAITDTRTALLAGLVGIGALLTFWLNSRLYRITALTLQATQQGQITERYTKAIEQLGSDKLDVRLGGIYALERIAKDSERDQPTVVEVLSAFARAHSDPEAEQAAAQESAAPRTDVQAALTVLGRLPQLAGVSRGDLRLTHLAGAYLRGAVLRRVVLQGADLRGGGPAGGGPAGSEGRRPHHLAEWLRLPGCRRRDSRLTNRQNRGGGRWVAYLSTVALRGLSRRSPDVQRPAGRGCLAGRSFTAVVPCYPGVAHRRRAKRGPLEGCARPAPSRHGAPGRRCQRPVPP